MKPLRRQLTSLFPREEWRCLLRSLLRECSYLPDPIARTTCHNKVLQRFRRYHDERRDRIRDNIDRLMKLHREARAFLSVLQRANDGYPRTLEKVLKLAYGRTGKRRVQMLNDLLAVDAPSDTEALKALVSSPALFEEGWEPPQVLMDLLKSQNRNAQLGNRSRLPSKFLQGPATSEKNSWGRSMPLVRRKTIRREWYNTVVGVLLPPLPDAELGVLNGLISGEIPWTPTKRRSSQHITSSVEASDVDSRGEVLRKVLTDGPQKEDTFGLYTNGRPHEITRRFMIRHWQRISCMVPRHHWDPEVGRHIFEWDTTVFHSSLALPVKGEGSHEIFGGFDVELDLPKKPKAPSPVR